MTAAFLAVGPHGVASHRTAAMLWSLMDRAPVFEFTVPPIRRARISGVIVHRASAVRGGEIRRIEGIRVTTPARTIIDLATVTKLSDLERILDEAIARRMVAPVGLLRSLNALGRRGRKGSATLASLLSMRTKTRGLPQSQFELRFLRMLEARKMPKPICQYPVRLPTVRKMYLDFAYPQAMLAIEADSFRFHSSRTDWSRDRARNNTLIALRWRVFPVTLDDVHLHPDVIVDQLAQCLDLPMIGRISG